jgi:hypothetical protein
LTFLLLGVGLKDNLIYMTTWNDINSLYSKKTNSVSNSKNNGWDNFNKQFSELNKIKAQQAKISQLKSETEETVKQSQKDIGNVKTFENILDIPGRVIFGPEKPVTIKNIPIPTSVSEGMGAAYNLVSSVIPKTIQAGTSIVAQKASDLITGKENKKTFGEYYKQAPDLAEFIAEPLLEITKKTREIQNKPMTTLDYFFPEFIGQLGSAGVVASVLAPIGSRISTKYKTETITPEQMADVVTGRNPQGAPLKPETIDIIKREVLAPETQKTIIKEAVKQGVDIKTTEPAGVARQMVGEFIGGGAEKPKTEITIKGQNIPKIEPIKPTIPQIQAPKNWEELNKSIVPLEEIKNANLPTETPGGIPIEYRRTIAPKAPAEIIPTEQSFSKEVNNYKNVKNELDNVNKELNKLSQKFNLTTSEQGISKLQIERNKLDSLQAKLEDQFNNIKNKNFNFEGERFTTEQLNNPAEGISFSSPLQDGEFYPIKKQDNGGYRAINKNTGELFDIPPNKTNSFYSGGWKLQRDSSFDNKTVADILDFYKNKTIPKKQPIERSIIEKQSITQPQPTTPKIEPNLGVEKEVGRIQRPVLSREEYLKAQIDKKIDEFRKSANIMPETKGAGVKMRPVYDAVGNINFVASDFKLSRAKAEMARRSRQTKQYAEQVLKENDPEFSKMLDEYNKIISEKPQLQIYEEPVYRIKSGNNLASTGKKKSVEQMIEERNGEFENKGFLLSERAKQILNELNIPLAEKTLSNKYLGIFKPLSKNVRVQAMHDITTVVHEATHAIDNKHNISAKLMEITGYAKNGNPIYSKETRPIRQLLTDIYEELYGYTLEDLMSKGLTAEQAEKRLEIKRGHKLETRIVEGLATFIENYFYNPSGMSVKYPVLVSEFIKKDGKYHNKDIENLLTKMNELVDDYAKLSPEERIGSRIRTGEEVIKKQSGFNIAQRAEFEIFNRFEPLKRYSKKIGVSGTWSDPEVQAFNLMNKNQFVSNFISGEKIPIIKKDGNFSYASGNVSDYMKLVSGKEKQFRSYLIARRVIANHNKLQLAEDEFLSIKDAFQELLNAKKQGFIVDNTKLKEYKQIMENYKRWKNIVKNDDFRLQDASSVVEKYKDIFSEAEKIYDNINKYLIDWSENTGLINAEKANTYKNDEGYSSWKRYIDDEISPGSIGTRGTSKGKVSSFKERTGSDLDIIDPVYNQISAINEIISKGLENLLWNKVYELSKKSPEIARRFEKIETTTAVDKNGNISWPQERDPNLLRIFVNGNRMFFKPAPEFIAVMKTLKPGEYSLLNMLLNAPASVFTRLTTSANPFFVFGNLTVDQFSALAQTKTGYKPIIDPAKSFVSYIKGEELIKDYFALGGKRQTLASFYKISPEEIPTKLLKISEKNKTKQDKIKTGIGKIIDVPLSGLETPSNLSEIMTRFAEFRRAKEMGKTDSEAMYMASQVTVPFQLQGNLFGQGGRNYIKSIPYFNAAIQVLYKFGKTAKTDPKRIGLIYAGILSTALTTAIATLTIASEEQKRLLAEQPARLLARYIYIPSPNKKDLIKVRIPEQFGALSGTAYLWAISHYTGNEIKFREYLDSILSFLPEQLDITEPKKLVLSWMPQTIKPSVMAITNTKTYPEIRPIIPDYMKYKEPSERYTVYTSKVAKYIGKLLNASPAIIESWIREQFGVVGGMLLGKMPSMPLYLQEKDYVLTGRAYNNFYDQRDVVDYQYNLVKDKKGDFSEQEKVEIRNRYKLNNEVAETLNDIRKYAQKKDFVLPENIKKQAFELLSKIDTNTINTSYNLLLKLRNDFYAVNK